MGLGPHSGRRRIGDARIRFAGPVVVGSAEAGVPCACQPCSSRSRNRLATAPDRVGGEAARLAVLEFETAPGLKIGRTYFSDLARGVVHRKAPTLFVLTRERTEALLAADGKTMADCQGNCEVEVGRKLGADYIISGG